MLNYHAQHAWEFIDNDWEGVVNHSRDRVLDTMLRAVKLCKLRGYSRLDAELACYLIRVNLIKLPYTSTCMVAGQWPVRAPQLTQPALG